MLLVPVPPPVFCVTGSSPSKMMSLWQVFSTFNLKRRSTQGDVYTRGRFHFLKDFEISSALRIHTNLLSRCALCLFGQSHPRFLLRPITGLHWRGFRHYYGFFCILHLLSLPWFPLLENLQLQVQYFRG